MTKRVTRAKQHWFIRRYFAARGLMGIIDQVAEILSHPDASWQIAYDPAVEPPQEGKAVGYEQSSLHHDLRAYLQSAFPAGLFAHQHAAVEKVLQGENTVVATRTSSGKSLIYSLPIFNALLEDPQSTGLFLFPQKALANDQRLKLQQMAAEVLGLAKLQASNEHLVSRYDGSTPVELRKQTRDRAQIVLTNPDMLHLGIMQHHQGLWARFFANLKVVAIDECHEYRGIFGTNVAYILRRLRQICALHGSNPRFVATSATIQSPEDHMRKLTGLDFTCIGPEKDTSRQGPRKFWLVRGDEHHYDTGRKLAKALAEKGLTVLVFCPSRVAAERMVSQTLRGDDIENSYVRVYRSGLSSQQREEIEGGLRNKNVRLVFSTSALELGVDIGAIDVVVCVGLPHTMMSLWQRSGRAARGGREGATILVPADTPIDSHYTNHPEELFARENEPLVLNLQNRRIASQHYACALTELGSDEDTLDTDLLGPEMTKIKELRAEGKLDSPVFYYQDPHIELNIRSGGERNFVLKVDDQEIGEIGHLHLLRECHPNAIYRHGGKSFRVLNILLGEKRVRLKRFSTANETRAHIQRQIRLKNEFRIADYTDLRIATVSVDVREFLVSVTEKDPSGATVRTWSGAMGMRDFRLPTEGTMLAFGEKFWETQSAELGGSSQGALLAVERLLASLFPTVSGPCDTQDYASAIGRLASGENAIFLYDAVFDGVDLTNSAFDHIQPLIDKAIERVDSCTCQSDEGCFRCIANPIAEEIASKATTLALLRAIQKVLVTTTPKLKEVQRDFSDSLLEAAVIQCAKCGQSLPEGAKFCSECGSKVEA